MNYDLIVVGAGTSGAFSAIASGRMRLKTLIIENNGYTGGTATGAIVSPMMSTLHDDYISDINEEVVSRLKETGDGFGNWFNPEMLKIVLEDMLVKSGVEIRYYSNVVDVIKEGENIKALCVQSKNGMEKFKGKIIIDATGDADLANLSGVKTAKGNAKGINQPTSIRFIMSNIDIKEFSNYVKFLGQKVELNENEFHTAHTSDGNFPLRPIFEKAIIEGKLLEEDARYFQCFSIPGRSKDLSFNCPEIFEQIDGCNVKDLTKAQIIGKQKILRYVKFLKTLPGFENAYLTQISPMVGVRESRRVIGRYILTAKDILTYKKFKNRIISSNYPVDIHNVSEEEMAYIENLRKTVNGKEKYYDIPADIMLCNEIQNLLVVGRCASADFIAQSAIRIQSICRAMGEAAAYMSYLSIKNQVPLDKVDVNSFQTLLKQKGFK